MLAAAAVGAGSYARAGNSASSDHNMLIIIERLRCDSGPADSERPDCDPCTGAGRAAATSAPGLGSPLPHLHRDWAHPPTTSTPGLGAPLPHLRRDWAHPCNICVGTGPALLRCHICTVWGPTGLTPPTSAPGLGCESGPLQQPSRRQTFLFGLSDASTQSTRCEYSEHPSGARCAIAQAVLSVRPVQRLRRWPAVPSGGPKTRTAILYIHTAILYIHTAIIYIRCTTCEQPSALPKLVLARYLALARLIGCMCVRL